MVTTSDSVILVGHADDELAEVWHDTRDLAFVALILNAVVIVLFSFALSRVLRPLAEVADGLMGLEQGQFERRLARPEVRELSDIADRFNALADRLSLSRRDNAALSRKLMSIQDEERRLIATELHDEWGPCVFGIKANLASLGQVAEKLPPAEAGRVRERIATIDDIAAKIQTMTRSLLGRLRPIALDHMPLGDAIASLVAEFQRNGVSPRVVFTGRKLRGRYDDALSLTIHRCVQEGITNALRHAQAELISIELTERDVEGKHDVELIINDDGRGIAEAGSKGLGLTGMAERVSALSGSIHVSPGPNSGTMLVVRLPIGSL